MQVSKKKQSLYTFIEKVEAPFCNKIVCISNAEKKSALDKNICRENKLQVIFNGIDIEAYKQPYEHCIQRRNLNIPENAFVIGMVGRISKQKAPDVFVEAAKKIKDKIKNAYFVIVGNGDETMYIFDLLETEIFMDTKRKKKANPDSLEKKEELVTAETDQTPEQNQEEIAAKVARKLNRIPFYPKDWKDSFGLSVEEHKKALETNLTDGYIEFSATR